MTIALEVVETRADAARRVAEIVAEQARSAVTARGDFSLAVSGGTTPAQMLRELGRLDVSWERVVVFQVDERVAPAGSSDRNLTLLLESLPPEAHTSVRPMPVEDPALEQAARRHAATLPERLDLVHLGLGEDGHTASLVPGDDALDVRDALVTVTGEYRGHRRLTLTYAALDSARRIVWLVTGAEKRRALRRLLDGDPSVPAARVENPWQLVVADALAAPSYEV